MNVRERTLLIFARAPQAGRVKTRLAKTVGPDLALRVYDQLARQTVAEACRLPGTVVKLLFTPADAARQVRAWLGPALIYEPQRNGDLGARMQAAFEDAFADGARQVAVIGTDLPSMSTHLLQRAFTALETRPAVLGPTRDGGYYLLGLRCLLPGLFREIPWSTSGVYDVTLARLREARVRPAVLPVMNDVDTVADLPPEWERRFGVTG